MSETMSYFPVAPRARRIAISFASEPVTAKFTTSRSPGIVPAISSASSTSHGLEYQDDSCTSFPACSRIVSVSSGCEWPSTMHIMPAVMSKYSLPSTSMSTMPWPRSNMIRGS